MQAQPWSCGPPHGKVYAPCCRSPRPNCEEPLLSENSGDFYEPCLAPCLCHGSVPRSPLAGTRGWAGTEEQGQGHRLLVPSARVILQVGALAIFNGDARGPDDYSCCLIRTYLQVAKCRDVLLCWRLGTCVRASHSLSSLRGEGLGFRP